MPRNAFIDHIRVVLTTLVILHHTAIAYGGSGGWYWREAENASNAALVVFNAFNQSFFMGFFFLLAGYFTKPALDRKGAAKFMQDRLLRLGIPLLLYFFLLHPLTVAVARTTRGLDLWPSIQQMFMEKEFAPGPLWFAEALLLFSALTVLWTKLGSTKPARTIPSFGFLLAIAILLGVVSFIVRFWTPVGEEVLWLQLGYFPCYVALFIAGYAAADNALLEKVTGKEAGPWLLITAAGVLLLIYLVLFRLDKGSFDGGWTWNSFTYALWDPLTGMGVILGMLWFKWGQTTLFTNWLSRNAYAAFVIHPLVVVSCGVLIVEWGIPLWVKFVAVGLVATAGSFVLGHLLRLVPALNKTL